MMASGPKGGASDRAECLRYDNRTSFKVPYYGTDSIKRNLQLLYSMPYFGCQAAFEGVSQFWTDEQKVIHFFIQKDKIQYFEITIAFFSGSIYTNNICILGWCLRWI